MVRQPTFRPFFCTQKMNNTKTITDKFLKFSLVFLAMNIESGSVI